MTDRGTDAGSRADHGAEQPANGYGPIRAAFERMCDAEDEVCTARSAFLRACGWEQTTETPGALCLWKKRLRTGETVLCKTDLALTIQDNLSDLHDEVEEAPRSGR